MLAELRQLLPPEEVEYVREQPDLEDVFRAPTARHPSDAARQLVVQLAVRPGSAERLLVPIRFSAVRVGGHGLAGDSPARRLGSRRGL